jgi:hypothetical protein
MLERIASHVRRNLVGYLALFVALSGTAVAGGILNKAKVNKIITKRAPGLTVANANALGGSPASAFVRGPSEVLRQVGSPGNPGFLTCATGHNWQDASAVFQHAAFYRDPLGVVHLTGSLNCAVPPGTNTTFFTLPAGYTPGGYIMFPSTDNNGANLNIAVTGAGDVDPGNVGLSAGSQVSLDGISFRCAPSGVNGCP